MGRPPHSIGKAPGRGSAAGDGEGRHDNAHSSRLALHGLLPREGQTDNGHRRRDSIMSYKTRQQKRPIRRQIKRSRAAERRIDRMLRPLREPRAVGMTADQEQVAPPDRYWLAQTKP